MTKKLSVLGSKLPLTTKTKFVDFCKVRKKTPSKMIRELIEREMRT